MRKVRYQGGQLRLLNSGEFVDKPKNAQEFKVGSGVRKWELKLATFATDRDEISFGFIPQKRTHRGWGGQQRRRERRGAPRRWGRKLQKCSQLPSPLETHSLSISVNSSTQMAIVRITYSGYGIEAVIMTKRMRVGLKRWHFIIAYHALSSWTHAHS